MSELQEFDDGFLDNEPEVEQEVEIVEEAAEPEVEAAPETEPETEETETETTAEEAEESTTDSKQEWTLTAVLDERDKRQKAVKEAEELRERLAKLEGEKTEDGVSVFEDEQAYTQQRKQETEEAMRNTALNMSEAFAETQFGEDKVAAAKQWMIDEGVKSPYALEQFNSAKLPYHKAVELYEDDLVRRDPEAYKAKLREELLEELKSENKPKPSTPSLASKRSAVAVETSVDSDDFLKD